MNFLNKLRLEECLTVIFLLISLALNLYLGVNFVGGFSEFLFFFFGMLFPFFVGLSLLGAVVLRQNPFALDDTLFLFRTIVLLFIGYYAYGHLKILIPLVNVANYDILFFDIDKFLFFGYSPTTGLAKIKDPLIVSIISFFYASYYAMFPAFLCVAFFRKNRPAIRKFICGLLIVNALGITAYYLLPSLGPVFKTPELFAHIPRKWPNILWEGYLAVQSDPANFYCKAFYGIAAFPSLHVAQAFFLILLIRENYRRLLWLFMPWFILLTFSTVYLGWHYAVDAVGGILIGTAAYVLTFIITSDRRMPRSQSPCPKRETLFLMC